MVIEIIQREIAARGVGCILLRDCPEERLGEALGKGMEKLKKAGARQVLAASLPEGEPLHPGPVGVWRLTHAYDLLRLEKPLAGPAKAEGGLTLRPVKRAEEKLYLDLVNTAQGGIPGFRLLAPGGLRRQNHRFAMAWQGDQPVGAYDLDLSERIPELVTLAVAPGLQRQGLGRALLRSVLGSLGGKAPACAITLPSTAVAGLSLLQSEGFAQTGVESSWFEVI